MVFTFWTFFQEVQLHMLWYCPLTADDAVGEKGHRCQSWPSRPTGAVLKEKAFMCESLYIENMAFLI